jgi:predicted outer membrane repeat protein
MLESLKAGALIAVATIALGGATGADAATFTVRDRSDIGGSARCTPSSVDLCTLRAAIQLANETPESDEIVLSPLTYEITLKGADDTAAAGDLDIRTPIVIRVNGAGATIDGKGLDRVFDLVLPESDLTLTNVTIRGGSGLVPEAIGSCSNGSGGAICVRSGAKATLIDVDVLSSTGQNGGGAFVVGELDVTRGTWNGNTAESVGAGIAVTAGASATLTDVTMSKNVAKGIGGAITVFGTGAQLTLTRSLIGAAASADANSAEQGGGIALFNDGTAVMENSTISGNTARTGGGGIYCDSAVPCINANNVTLAKNSVVGGGGGGILVESGAAAPVFLNSILADNGPDDCAGALSGTPNLVENRGSCPSLDGWITGKDPALGALADNGGATRTHAIADETAALGKGDPATCLETDQRVEERRQRDPNQCDLGAFELVPDADKDGISDRNDLCPETKAGAGETTTSQKDADNDGVGDACDCGPPKHRFEKGTRGDDDGDGVFNYKDCCPSTVREAPAECGEKLSVNAQGCTVPQGCACEFKVVDDPVEGRIELPWRSPGAWRRCVKRAVNKLEDVTPDCSHAIASQTLSVGNAQGCGKSHRSKSDRDGDGVSNVDDNCPRKFNPRQKNTDEDSEDERELPKRGNACDRDNDNDNLPDREDKCPNVISCKNEDADSDGFGNECDECPWVSTGAPKDDVGCEAGDDQGHKGPVDPPENCDPPVGGGGGGGGGDDDDGDHINSLVTR